MTTIPEQVLQKTSFGELSVAEPTPIIQLQFTYNNNLRQVIPLPVNGASISNSDSHVVLSTAAAANNNAQLFSRALVRYNNGQGNVIKFTTVFSQGVAGSEQLAGIGNCCDGLMFGYDGTDFGFLRRRGGDAEIRTLEITTASSTAENVTITLDGNAVSVPVTASGDAATTAREIAEFIYLSTTTYGYAASPHGEFVTFIALDSGSHNGSFSLSGATTAVGSFSQDIAGANTVDDWTHQPDWNVDKFDGNGPSKMILNPQMGNVYKIVYQWLGYGHIDCFIEDQSTGDFQLAHSISYTNQHTETNLRNPSIPVFVQAKNTSNTSVITVRTPSLSAFVEGKDRNAGNLLTADSLRTEASTNEVPVLIIRNKTIYQNQQNRVEIKPLSISLVSSLIAVNNSVTFRVYLNAVIEGSPAYTDVDTNDSVMEFDIAGTSFNNGEKIGTFQLSSTESRPVNIADLDIKLIPSVTMLITAEIDKANAANQVGAVINWEELL